jgi:hypothetical protein
LLRGRPAVSGNSSAGTQGPIHKEVRREGAPFPAGESPARGVVDTPRKLSGDVVVSGDDDVEAPRKKAFERRSSKQAGRNE